MPFRYLHFVSPRIDTFLFVGIGIAAFALHERDRMRSFKALEASNPKEQMDLPEPFMMHQLIRRKAERWWNGVETPSRLEALAGR
ncbi:hypothetical protein HDU98_010627 [Podochytrium sp. JEL0797]|nr:hypothetical protein HDU98_010627 [Podochytrium sp. JEL0797]